MVVVREFSDEGKSGKNVDGRPQFKEMLEMIEIGTDDIDYVLVFKIPDSVETPPMFLVLFRKCKLSDAEKKEFMGTFVESIGLYPERLENGKFLKHIHFRFPVYYNGTVIDDISWENGSTVETVVLLSKIHEASIM